MTFQSRGGALNVSRLAAIAEAAPCPACAIKAELSSLTARGGYSKSSALAKSPKIRALFVHECGAGPAHEPRRSKISAPVRVLEQETTKGDSMTEEQGQKQEYATVHYEAKKNRQTGTRIIVWKMPPTEPKERRYMIECVAHLTEHYVSTVAETKIATTPSVWCTDCSRQVATKQAEPVEADADAMRAVMAG